MFLVPESVIYKRIKFSSLQYLKLRKEVKMGAAIFVEMGKNMEK